MACVKCEYCQNYDCQYFQPAKSPPKRGRIVLLYLLLVCIFSGLLTLGCWVVFGGGLWIGAALGAGLAAWVTHLVVGMMEGG